MNKLFFLCQYTCLSTRMDRNNYNFLMYLKNNSKYDIYMIDTSNQNTLDTLICKDDIIITTCNYSGLYGEKNYTDYIKKFNNIKILIVEDVRCRCKYKCLGNNRECRWQQHIKKNQSINYDYYIFRYKTYITHEIYNLKKSYYLQHYIDISLFNNKQLTKK